MQFVIRCYSPVVLHESGLEFCSIPISFQHAVQHRTYSDFHFSISDPQVPPSLVLYDSFCAIKQKVQGNMTAHDKNPVSASARQHACKHTPTGTSLHVNKCPSPTSKLFSTAQCGRHSCSHTPTFSSKLRPGRHRVGWRNWRQCLIQHASSQVLQGQDLRPRWNQKTSRLILCQRPSAVKLTNHLLPFTNTLFSFCRRINKQDTTSNYSFTVNQLNWYFWARDVDQTVILWPLCSLTKYTVNIG